MRGTDIFTTLPLLLQKYCLSLSWSILFFVSSCDLWYVFFTDGMLFMLLDILYFCCYYESFFFFFLVIIVMFSLLETIFKEVQDSDRRSIFRSLEYLEFIIIPSRFWHWPMVFTSLISATPQLHVLKLQWTPGPRRHLIFSFPRICLCPDPDLCPGTVPVPWHSAACCLAHSLIPSACDCLFLQTFMVFCLYLSWEYLS